MNVEEFVSENIKQIAKGLISAQKSGINLAGGTGRDIKFDIAVTVSDSIEAGGKAGITVWSIGAEAKAKTQITSNTVSRIQFVVPIFYPDPSMTID
jgi:hypothetical protein